MDDMILLETNEYLVINKPAGLMVHPDGKKQVPTLTDFLIARYPEMKGVGEPVTFNDTEIDRPGIVHRLDEETSGVLVVAKTKEAFIHFKKQFMDRTIQKEYHAVVWGYMKEEQGVIDEPIGRNKNDFRKKHAGRGIRGETKEALTVWECSARFSDETGEAFSFVRLFPKTGRTHQLRVHMKFIQRPIVSDTLYAPSKPKALGFERLALHAKKISFLSPDGQTVSVEAPYPADFAALVAKYQIS